MNEQTQNLIELLCSLHSRKKHPNLFVLYRVLEDCLISFEQKGAHIEDLALHARTIAERERGVTLLLVTPYKGGTVVWFRPTRALIVTPPPRSLPS